MRLEATHDYHLEIVPEKVVVKKETETPEQE